MSETIFYQWQNDHLLRTIYPLRELKLRDFLIFYHEIEIWQEYKDKTIDDIAGEVQEHRDRQTRLWRDQYETYHAQRSYFLTEDVTERYREGFPEIDQSVLDRINRLHKDFCKYFPKYNNLRKEKIYLTRQVRLWQDYYKDLQDRLAIRSRVLGYARPDWPGREEREEEVRKLRDVSKKMVEEELSSLSAFLSAFSNVEELLNAVARWKNNREEEAGEMVRRRGKLQIKLEELRADWKKALSERTSLANPPDYDAQKAEFLTGEAFNQYRDKFTDPDPTFLAMSELAFGEFSRWLPSRDTIDKQIHLIDRLVSTYSARWKAHKGKAGEMAREALRVMRGLQTAAHVKGSSPGQVQAEIAALDRKLQTVEAEVESVAKELQTVDVEALRLRTELNTPFVEQINTFAQRQDISVRDVVRGKVEEYENELLQKTHEELLELIVERFVANPERYPLWLQYMVVHFSGMRYKSAHGSWADPKDLLSSLRSHAVEKEMSVDDAVVKARCEEKLESYRKAIIGIEKDESEKVISKLDLNKPENRRLKERLERHLKGLESANPYRRRASLLNLRIEEEAYEVEHMSREDVLEELTNMKSELPDWMWKEIVRLTNLRLTEVSDDEWEAQTDSDREEMYLPKWNKYRELMNDWKRANLVGWRAEHDRTNRLIVTRAVCNEVAEHIQHLRGWSPPGGLTAKPEWYLRKEKDPSLGTPGNLPYFVKPVLPEHFREGASIFWLRFVDSQPNQWQIARPITLKSGEGLLTTVSFAHGNLKSSLNKELTKGKTSKKETEWVYQGGTGTFKRFRYTMEDGEKKSKKMQAQWLRWMHEATVVRVADTADGTVVLTFETALPYEDRRRSTIGVFRHSFQELKHNVGGSAFNATFVGFVPPADLPYDDLREMLDWNKILRREYLTEEEMDAYWEKVSQAQEMEGGRLEPGLPEPNPGSPVEVCPPALKLHQKHSESVLCYTLDGSNKMKAYIPKVDIRRGVRLYVRKDRPVESGGSRYYQVVRCDDETRAQDLYIRADVVIDAPADRSSRPVVVKERVNLGTIKFANNNDMPVVEEYRTEDKSKVQLRAGAVLRVSTVHKITQKDMGDGRIRGDGERFYYLVAECPYEGNAHGLFVHEEIIKDITEEEYARAASFGGGAPEELVVRAAPRDGKPSIHVFLGKTGAIKRSGTEQIPKDDCITVVAAPVFDKGKEFYRIAKYEPSPAFQGKYVLIKDVDLEEERAVIPV